MEDLKPRPCGVKYAVALMIASIAIGLVRSYVDYEYYASLIPTVILYATWGILSCVYLLLILFIHLEFNWARITMLVLDHDTD